MPEEPPPQNTSLNTGKLVLKMMDTLYAAGHRSFRPENIWEQCFCALVLALKPNCKTHLLLESLPFHRHEYDRIDILNSLSHLGFFARKARTRCDHIDERLLPCLFIPEEGLPFVIYKNKSADDLETYPNDPNNPLAHKARLYGEAWIFVSYDENRPAISKFMREGSGHSWFRALMGRFKPQFRHIMITGLFLNVISLIPPIFIMLVYDRVVASGLIGTLPMLTAGAILAIISEWSLRRIRTRGLAWVAGRMDHIVGSQIFSHLIGLPPALIESASVSAQIARIKTFEAVRDFFSSSVFIQLIDIPFVFISVLAIYAIAGPIVIVPLLMVGAYALLFWSMRQKIKVAIRLAAKASSARQQFTIETFDKMDGIREYGLDDKWQDKFRIMTGREMMSLFHLGWLGMVTETIAHSLTILSAVLTVALGVHFIWNGDMTTGGLVATMILVWRILTPFYSLCTMVPRLEQLRNSVIQINKLMDVETEAEEAKSASKLPSVKGNVEFQNVGLRYGEDHQPVLINLSCTVQAGQLMTIAGASGSGKSSVLKIVHGMFPPQMGSVLIDGFDIRQLDIRDLRRQIAYVSQTPYFFDATIEANLRLASPICTNDDIQQALELTGLWSDIETLPKGLQTRIGRRVDTNSSLSMAAKLSLARAYLHPGKLMLIDELPNDLLNGKTGQSFKQYLSKARGQRTIIMATHRDDIMRMADHVLFLREHLPPVFGKPSEVIDEFISPALKEEAA